MKKIFLGLLALGLTAQLSAQVVDDGMLPEVEVRATNYKYLNSVDNTEAAVPVKLLEDMVAHNFSAQRRAIEAGKAAIDHRIALWDGILRDICVMREQQQFNQNAIA